MDEPDRRSHFLGKILRTFDKFFGKIVEAMNLTGAAVIFGVLLLVCSDITMRNAASQPIHGVPELVGQSIVVIMFLQLASTIRHRRIARAELGTALFKFRWPRFYLFVEFLIAMVGGLVCILIATTTVPRFVRSVERSEVFGTEGIFAAPLWPVRLIVVIGAAIAAIQFFLIAARYLGHVFSKNPKIALED